MIGDTISRYRIIDSLGEGGMGTVYLAQDITLGRQVAIKFLTSTTTEYRARFLREARAISALTHANIATVFDYGETHEGRPYIVMELIKGQPLSEKLEEGSLPLPEAVQIVLSIAAALAEAHHHKVVHRDIKPSNVIITARGLVKVLDFGLVKQIPDAEPEEFTDSSRPTIPGARTRSDVIVGTPLYLSPEQATGKKVDGRSDLFALGAVLYECLTGQSAFTGSNTIEISAQVIYVTPPVPSRINSHIPSELDRITMKALEKKAEARYQTAEELIRDLKSLLASLDVDGFPTSGRSTRELAAARTHPASALTTLTETFRRPRLSLATYLLTILVIAAVGWAVYRWLKPAPYKPTPLSAEWFNKGTDALRNGALLQASKAFEQSVANDKRFPLASARLAEVWFELDYADRAKDEMLRAQSLVPNRSQLASSDSLYLEAINATVTRDFPGAIKAYTELVRLSPNEAQAYVDLGRAYEKNDEPRRAIETYVEATQRGPQHPTAFLRLGVLYGEQLDLPAATANFDKAQTLFEALANYEGQAEVVYQRGALFDRRGKAVEARPHLERALELSKATANQYLEVRTLLKLGNVAISEGSIEGGRQLIRQAIDTARSNGIDNQVKRGLVDFGNTYLVSADYQEAEKYYLQSLELSQQQKDNRNATRALLALGGVFQRQGKTDEAIRYLEQALPFYRQGGYRKEAAQALVMLGRTKVQKGDFSAALEAFKQQLELAEQLGDPSLTMAAHGELGYLLVNQGRFTEALPHFERNLTIARSMNSEKDIALGLTSCANTLWQLGRYDEARVLLAEAAPLTEKPNAARNMAAWFFLTEARLALSENRWPHARNRSEQAIDLAGNQLRVIATEANFTLGLAHAKSGAFGPGRAACDKAVAIARETGNPSLQADSLLALAQVMSLRYDQAPALKTASESYELLTRIGKPHYEWIALLLMARASETTGDRVKARDYAARAETTLSELQQKWGPVNYNSYLNRQDIQFYRNQLSQLFRSEITSITKKEQLPWEIVETTSSSKAALLIWNTASPSTPKTQPIPKGTAIRIGPSAES